MIYVNTLGECKNSIADIEDDFLKESGCKTLEDALIKLGYHYTLVIGAEEALQFELHINQNQNVTPAAIGFMNYIGLYELYAFESKHAALLFLKDFSPTILAIDEYSKKDR